MSDQDRHPQQQIVGPPSARNGKRKALIIGISKYDHGNKFPNLDFCENDAEEVYRILKDQGYDMPENRLLIGTVEWAKMREEIIKFFADRTLRPEDTLFFYFSGHGYLDRNTNRTFLSTSGIDPAWPALKAIPFEELTTYINDSNSERIVTVLDCCYSGALEVGGKGAEEGEDDQETAKSEKGEEIASLANTNLDRTVKRLIRSGQGKCVLASSLEEQKSFKMEGQPYSTFTYFLIEGLKGVEGESVDDNGYVTPELLGKYINKKVLELDTIKQKPVRKTDITGEIILAHYPNLAKSHQSPREYLLHLLTDGRIEEFNEIRKGDNYPALDLYYADFSGKNLRSINLKAVFLSSSKLIRADLFSANLSSAKLIDADLSSANLEKADLSNADLTRANLAGADLYSANLSGANLEKANLSWANLENANLTGAKLWDANLTEAGLSDANLSKADLAMAYLSYYDRLTDPGANLERANLTGANLEKANLSNADLTRANLAGADLYSANLSGANLEKANLTDAKLIRNDLTWAKLEDANLEKADLTIANLSGANLEKANLSGANLVDANLEKANLSGANLVDANLEKANLSGANLENADLSGASLAQSLMIGLRFGKRSYPKGFEFLNNESYPLCDNTKFDSTTIIDNQKLYEHFRNNSGSKGERVRPAVKDKNELREKLEKRGFNEETIDKLLSFSSLPDSP